MEKESCEQINEIKKSLAEFIIRTTKEDAPDHAVQVLPEAVKSYVQLIGSGF